MEIHEAYARMLLSRYAENPRAIFRTGRNVKDARCGIIGQRLFQSFLNQYRIPYIHDEPAFKFAEERLVSDFTIPHFGALEIKTRPWNTDTMIIQKVIWDTYVKEETVPDYVVALKLKPEENLAEIVGYEHGKEVSGLPNAPDICIYSPCYSKPYRELHPFSEILVKLKACSMKRTKSQAW